MPIVGAKGQVGKLPGPPRKPVPGENVHPDSRLAQPKQEHPKVPVQILKAHGFNGNIDSFNKRVEHVRTAFVTKFQQDPSPGLVFDVATNEKLMDNQIFGLFNVPLDSRQAKIQNKDHQDEWTGDKYMKYNGRLQKTNPLTAWQRKILQERKTNPWAGISPVEEQAMPNNDKVYHYQKWDNKYNPMGIGAGVMEMLPKGMEMGKDLVLTSGGPSGPVPKLGNLANNPKALEQYANTETEGEYGSIFAEEATSPTAKNILGAKSIAPVVKQIGKMGHQDAIQRNQTRQNWLKSHDPYHLFKDLPSNGVFTAQWMTQFDKWSRTGSTGELYLNYLAGQNSFPQTPQGIHQMIMAQKTRVNYIKSKKSVLDKWIAETMPLRFFQHHEFPMSIYNIADKISHGHPGALVHDLGQTQKDIFDYVGTGTHWYNPISVLHAGWRAATLEFDLAGGITGQALADLQASSAAVGQSMYKLMGGKESWAQVEKKIHQNLEDNPDLVRAFGMGFLPQHLHGKWAALDSAGNITAQVALALLIHAPAEFELSAETPIETWKASPFLKGVNRASYQLIKMGKLDHASTLMGGVGSEKFIKAVEPLVRSGAMSMDDFQQLAVEAARNGKVTLADGRTIKSYPYIQLRQKTLPKHVTTIRLKEAYYHLSNYMQKYETWARDKGALLSTSSHFLRQARGLMMLASPEGKFYDPMYMPIRNFKSFMTNNNLFAPEDIQNITNGFIKARASGNRTKMDKLFLAAVRKYEDKFPLRTGYERSPIDEIRGEYHFPDRGNRRRGKNTITVGEQKTSPFDAITSMVGVPSELMDIKSAGLEEGHPIDRLFNALDTANEMVNRYGRVWRQSILATGPGLFFKHLARDPLAAFLGGFKLHPSKLMLQSEAAITKMVSESPEAYRLVSGARGAVTRADLEWSRSFRFARPKNKFNLLDEVAKNEKNKDTIAGAAAQWVEGHVANDLYPGYLHYKATGDITPMVNYILHNRKMRKVLESKGASKLVRARMEKENQAMRTLGGKQELKNAAAEYAKTMSKSFDDIQEAGKKAGVDDLLGTTAAMFHKNPGLAGQDVAKFLLDKKVPLDIPDGEIVPMNAFDRATGKAIKTYMSANTKTREKMFDNILHQSFISFIHSGYDPMEALRAATNLAKDTTQYHLLDFSNTLEFERKFRGILPFMTKHRLFIKWLMHTFASRPLLALPVHEIGQKLDSQQRINFSVHGMPLNFSLGRLLFLTSEQQGWNVPFFNVVPKLDELPMAGSITRIDPAFNILKNILVFHVHNGVPEVGVTWNYDKMVEGMDPFTRNRLDKYMTAYAINVRLHKGLDAPVSAHEALKWSVARMMTDIPVNGLVGTPVSISSPNLPPRIQKLNDRYDSLVTKHPQEAANLLDQHPELSLAWGRTQNFNVWNHNSMLWAMYDKLVSKYHKEEDKYTKLEMAGKMTPKDYLAMKRASDEYQQGFRQLQFYDAYSWQQNHPQGEPGAPPSSADRSTGEITAYGPWYNQLAHNPAATEDKLIKLFGGDQNFSTEELKNIYGDNARQIENEIKVTKDPTVKGQLIQKLQKLEGARKITSFWGAYNRAKEAFNKKAFGPKGYQGERTISTFAAADKNYKVAELIRQNYEHPYIKYKGKEIKVLPFTEFDALSLSPGKYGQRILGGAVKYPYKYMTIDQRAALGLPSATPALDKAWHNYALSVSLWERANPGKIITRKTEDDLAIQYNRQFPGFWRDYQVAHWPRAFVLYDYGKKLFNTPYGAQWHKLVTWAIQAYQTDKGASWGEYVTNTLDPAIKNGTGFATGWPEGFRHQYEAAGGAKFLQLLTENWQ